jgi:hypothetical protein
MNFPSHHSKDLFYQLALQEFSNFGIIALNPPAPIDTLLKLCLERDASSTASTTANHMLSMKHESLIKV